MEGRSHILVVDDEEPTLRGLAYLLEAAHYRVSTALDGFEALDEVQRHLGTDHQVDLVVTDLFMPEMSGLALIDALGRSEPRLPVIAVTGYGDEHIRAQLARRGCLDYLEKPIDPGVMLDLISTVLKGRSLAPEADGSAWPT